MNPACWIGDIFIDGNQNDFPAFVKHNFQIRLIRAAVAVEKAEYPLRFKNLPARFQIFGQLADVLKTPAKPAAMFLKIFRRCFYAEIARFINRTKEPCYCQQGSQAILADAVKRQAAQKVREMFDLFVTCHDRALEDADFVFGTQ